MNPAAHRIMLVDDHPLIIEWLSTVMRQEPDLVVCGHAASPNAAWERIASDAIDLVLLDLSFPRESGLEFIRRLRADRPQVRILVLSMHEEATVIERALQAGADGYVTKRKSIPEIVAAIRKVLSGETYAPAIVVQRAVMRLPTKNGSKPDVSTLSERERQVFELRGQGVGARQIAARLGVGVKAIQSYEVRIRQKLNLMDTSELVRESVLWVGKQQGAATANKS